MQKTRFFSAKNVALIGVFTALVIVLQSVALVTGLFLVTSISLVLIPIVLGGAVLGVRAGGLLGFVFGVVVLLFGVFGWDKFTAYLLGQNAWMTVLICLVKGTAAGLVSGALYTLIAKRNRYAAIVTASLAAPVVNTGLFLLGAMCMWDVFSALAAEAGVSVMYFLVVTCAAVNFAVEFVSTTIAAPSLYRVMEAVSGSKAKNKPAAANEAQEGTEGAPAASQGEEGKQDGM